MILFSELFSRAGVIPESISGDVEVTTLVMDSRKATPGCCFVCMPSETGDSHRFLLAAREAGAAAAIVHSREGFDAAVALGLVGAFVEPSLGGSAGVTPSQFAPLTVLPLQGEGEAETPEQRMRRTTGGFSEAMWRLAKVAFGDPSIKLKVIGVTGTNGKTTTAWLIRDMLNLLGIPCAYIGTLGFGLPRVDFTGSRVEGRGSPRDDIDPHSVSLDPSAEELRPLENTTPFSIELNAMLAECVERGCQAVAMEVSSHALAERRVDGIEFDVAVFTNLSQDHLDYHGTMEVYEAAKWRLFSEFPLSRRERGIGGEGHSGASVPPATGWSVLNRNDPKGEEWFHALSWRRVGYTYHQEPTVKHVPEDVWGMTRSVTQTAIDASIFTPAGTVQFVAPFGGTFNVENLLAVASVGYVLDRTICSSPYKGAFAKEVSNALGRVRPVPGRFEPVPNDSGIGIIVDYAHTPDALEKLLATVRPLTKGRVITVFGCGGDRDKSKRPLMARAAQEGSDVVVVTSDNPRTEDPGAIIRDICDGFEGPRVEGRGSDAENVDPRPSSFDPFIEPARPAAVALALRLAEPGDTVVIAGKGHENYQIIGREKIHMDDRELAREGLRLRNV